MWWQRSGPGFFPSATSVTQNGPAVFTQPMVLPPRSLLPVFFLSRALKKLFGYLNTPRYTKPWEDTNSGELSLWWLIQRHQILQPVIREYSRDLSHQLLIGFAVAVALGSTLQHLCWLSHLACLEVSLPPMRVMLQTAGGLKNCPNCHFLNSTLVCGVYISNLTVCGWVSAYPDRGAARRKPQVLWSLEDLRA